jgi:hypothetical protein
MFFGTENDSPDTGNRIGAAFIYFEQRYKLTEYAGDITSINFVDDKKETLVGLFTCVPAQALENAFAQVEGQLSSSVFARPITFDEILIAVCRMKRAGTHEPFRGIRAHHLRFL